MSDKTPNALISALIKARKDIHNPGFDSKNPHFKSKFASLKACLEAVNQPLLDNGIVMVQDFESRDGGCVCRTHLMHESGESLTFFSPLMTPTKAGPQEWASLSTYARRYGLMAAAAIVGDDDDDGNAASQPAFDSKQMKTKVWNALKDAAAEEDALKARETWDELTTEQQKEVWKELSSGQRSTLKKLLGGES